MDVPSIMVEEDLTKLREAYRIPADIELILPGPNERACFSRRGCTSLHLNAFASGMRLPLHPMLRRILRLAPTQVAPNGWSQMVGDMYLWFRHSFGMEMPLHVFKTIYQPRKLPRKKGREEERVFDDPEPDLDVPSVYGIASPLPRCELSQDVVDVLRSIYQADQKARSYGLILNRYRCLVNLGLMASKAEMDQGRRPRPTLPRLTKQRPKTLAPGYVEDTSQRKAIEDLSRAGNKEVVEASKVIEVEDTPEVEVPLSRKRKARTDETGTSQARRSVRGSRQHGAKISDDALRNLPFYPFMGAQAVNKYFTPKWEEFSSHGELEDVLEASLASAIRASTMQMKADKEHQQALEGLQAALDSTRTAYEQMEAALKESDSNLLNLTKQLDNANVAQKVAAEALEPANKEKRRLLEEAKSRDEEVSCLRKDLELSENGKKEAEAGKGEVEARLSNAEADFVANFHNTEAYTNFSDYFARVGQQGVLTALRNDHSDFDVKSLEARFPPPDVEGGRIVSFVFF
ncbi:Uncharacterized protein Adt_05797 [Abeliophyllum distichum]|uniref:Transposase (putative) gypsy type domain-containing protein n=1 Tax=Abeliophyllum distichum TaxID=126358 RepID=A0ABD1V5I6_9LAMI